MTEADYCIVTPEWPHPHPSGLSFNGERHEGNTWVFVGAAGEPARVLPLYLDVRAHSRTGFEWGYSGSGPAQLALAMCIEVVGRARALGVYQSVKDALVAPICADSWMLGGDQICAAIEAAEKRLGSTAHQKAFNGNVS